MKWLFVHQNFPGQYLHVVRYLARRGDEVIGIGQRWSAPVDGVRWIHYAPAEAPSTAHEYVREFDLAVQNGLAVARECESLRSEGFVPDLVIGHGGWGETLYIKDIWPTTPLLTYFEFFYRASGSDIDFDPEAEMPADIAMRLRTRNAINLVGLDAADWGHTPTRWQRDQYPQPYWERISIIHEGVDTDQIRPGRSARLWLSGGISLGREHEVITYSARNLEPYRGFHIFMRALPKILRERPNAHAIIVGGDGVSYGPRPTRAANWRQQLLEELAGEFDQRRVHFVGRLAFSQYLSVLQLSRVHVYLTYPFVLSWSLLEALSTGCLVIGSRTAPVQEVITDGENGWLVDFFDIEALADRAVEGLSREASLQEIRVAARNTIVTKYDLSRVCLPAFLSLLQRLTGKEIA
jgi:glycosyltransferase involved in cell wall biosynthesis